MTTPTVSTDLLDYAPGSTAIITASGFAPGATVMFEVDHTSGEDSGAGHTPWYVIDGGAGDLDGVANGVIRTTWYVSPDDSLGATFLLTAKSAGADGVFGTADDVTATTRFTDSGITAVPGVIVSLDESPDLQNASAAPGSSTDGNNTDILVASLPSDFSARLTALGAGTPSNAALSGYTGVAGNTGSNVFTISPAMGATITNVRFVDSTGSALAGVDSELKAIAGTKIFLYSDSVNDNIVLGRVGNANDTPNASGAIVFAAYIEETGSPVSGGKIWTVEYSPLFNPDATKPDDPVDLTGKIFVGTTQNLQFSLDMAPSGQNLFLMFTQSNPGTLVDGMGVTRITDPTIIATGKDPANQSLGVNISTGDTINTSQAGGPTTFGTNNQMVVVGEGLRFSFVTGARQDVTIPNLDQNEAKVEANIDFTAVFGARSASFDIVQLQSGKSAVVKITAYSTAAEPGDAFIDGYVGDATVAITALKVNGAAPAAGTFTVSGGVWTISGIKAGDKIEYTTTVDHNRVLVENAGSGKGQASAAFDVGGFTLTQVTVASLEVGSKMIFEDDGPTANGTAQTGTVDEDGLANGIAGGTDDVAGEFTTASGSVAGIFQSGADTPLTYALNGNTAGLPALTSGGVALVYSVAGNTLTAKASGVDVFTFAITNTTTGAYTFTLLKPLDHAPGLDENDITINLGSVVQATDKDGDTVVAAADKVVITVDDDTPTATGTAQTGTVDEDGLANGIAGGVGDVPGTATTASGSVAGIFQSGADTPLTYSLNGNTAGLPALNSGGVALVYSVAGNTLTAKAGAAGPDVFTFAITDTATGAYLFTLLKPLDHAPGLDENDITINLGSVVQATDKDGDTVVAAADKVVITVDDDTPTATGTAQTGTVDEDGLANGIAGGVGDVPGTATTASGSVAGIFQSGADTPLTYSLNGNTAGLPALNSGGVALVYSVAGNTLTAKAGAAGPDVFTFAITDTATGAYLFTLLKPLDHAPGLDENDITINLGTLVQATDKDGDTVVAAADKVVITVDDDTPTANGTAQTGTVDEDGLANGIAGGVGDVPGTATTASGSVAGIFQSGADTPLTYSLNGNTAGLPALNSGGVALVYSVAGNTLTAKAGAAGPDVFTFAITDTATGAYLFTLLKPLDHAPGLDENDITINLGTLVQATDKDGDTVVAAADKVVITVDDDTPTANGTAQTGTVDEDGLANGIAGGVGDVPGTATTASGSVAGIFQSGADTPLTYALNGNTAGLPALTSGGVALVYSVAGNTLTAKASGVDVFTFAITNTTTGAYTFTLLKPLDHAPGLNENDITINLGTLVQATDKDGDTVVAAADKVVITVDDDTPTANGTAQTGTVDEDGLANGIAGGTDDVAGEFTTASGSVAGIFQSGADTPLTYALNGNTAGLPALTSGGVALVYSVAGNTLTAKASGVDVFTFAITNTTTGAYTFTLLKPLDHAPGLNENDITINLGTLVQATDKDGDTVVAAADKVVITVDDDTPTANGTAQTGTVDEDGLANGIAGGTDDVAGEFTTASGSVAGIFQSGADTPLTYALNGNTAGLPALTSGGVALVYSVAGNTLTAKASGVDVFTFAITNTTTGAYTFTLLKPLDHAPGLDENDITINLGSVVQATDKDGDTVVAAADKVVITVDDDTPTLAFGNLVGTGTVNPQYGYWNGATGADGLGANGLDMVLNSFTIVPPGGGTPVDVLTFTFAELAGSPNGTGAYLFAGSLTGDFDNNASTANTTVDFSLTAFANGTYALDLVQGFGSSVTFSSANGSLPAGGPDPVQTLMIPGLDVVFFAVNPTALQTGIKSAILLGEPDNNEANLQMRSSMADYDGISGNGNQPGTGEFSFINDTYLMNVSTSGIGVGNNVLQGDNSEAITIADESFVVNPGALLTSMKVFIDNSVGGYNPANESLYYTVYYANGNTGATTKVQAGALTAESGGQVSFIVNSGVGPGELIDAVQLTMARGAIKIPVIEFTVGTVNLASDVKLGFLASLFDKDGDVATSAFTATLNANKLPGATFDYVLAGTVGARDAFDIDLPATQNKYQVTGFDTGNESLGQVRDKLVFLGSGTLGTINNGGADSIVTVNETGGQVTTVTVVGVDLETDDVVFQPVA